MPATVRFACCHCARVGPHDSGGAAREVRPAESRDAGLGCRPAIGAGDRSAGSALREVLPLSDVADRCPFWSPPAPQPADRVNAEQGQCQHERGHPCRQRAPSGAQHAGHGAKGTRWWRTADVETLAGLDKPPVSPGFDTSWPGLRMWNGVWTRSEVRHSSPPRPSTAGRAVLSSLTLFAVSDLGRRHRTVDLDPARLGVHAWPGPTAPPGPGAPSTAE